MKWLNKITVEPAMFLQQAGDTLTYVIFQNLFIDKICRVQLNYEASTCQFYESIDEELSPAQEFLRPVMNKIQEKSSEFLLYNSLVENSLPVLLVLFLGVWSDAKRRRKPCLLLSLVGKLLRSIGLLANAYFLNWHPIVLLFTVALPHSMGGANGVFHMAAFSYIADSSVPRDRTWRLGIAEAFWQLGSPVGLFLGGYLYERGGYLCVFSTAVLFHLTAVLYTVLVLPEVPQPRQSQLTIGKYGSYGTVTEYIIPARVRCFSENEKVFRERDEENDAALATEPLLNPGYLTRIPTENNNTENEVEVGGTKVKDFLIGSLKAVVKKRPNHTRKCLLSLGFIMLLYGILNHGEVNMKYLFTRNRFQWREQQFTLWTVFDSTVVVVGLTFLLPILSQLFKLSDPLAGAIAALGRVVSRLTIAFAPSSEYLYIAAAIDVAGVIGPLSARSLASKCVLRDERGKVFAFLGCIEALVPLLAVPLYSLIYSSTLTTEPSAIYFVSAALCLVIFIIFGILYIASKMEIISLTGMDTSSLLNPTQRHSQDHEGETGFFYTYRRFSLS